jgi:hypothetical protein
VAYANEPDASTLAAGACVAAPSNFTACGGSPVGTWRLTGIGDCDDAQQGIHDFLDSINCPSGHGKGSQMLRSWVRFVGDGTFSAGSVYRNAEAVTFPKSCLPMGTTSCSVLATSDTDASDGDTTTVEDSGTECSIESVSEGDDHGTGTWTQSGGTLNVVEQGRTDARPIAYCIDGDRISVREGDGSAEDPYQYSTFARL